MRYSIMLLLALVATTCLTGQNRFVDPATSTNQRPRLPPRYDNQRWELVFSDEFNDGELNPDKWEIVESQESRTPRGTPGVLPINRVDSNGYYVDEWYWRRAMVEESGGRLNLEARKIGPGVMHTGSVRSRHRYQARYGYYECEVRIGTAAQGTHTAFWLQADTQNELGDWGIDGAEIDIFESAWHTDATNVAIHADGYDEHQTTKTFRYRTPGLHDEGLHTFGMLWTPSSIQIFYDGLPARNADGDLIIYSTDNGNGPEPDTSGYFVPRVGEYLWLSNGASFGTPAKGSGNPFVDQFTDHPPGYLTRARFNYVRVWQFPEDRCGEQEMELETFRPSPVDASLTRVDHSQASGGRHLLAYGVQTGGRIAFPMCHNVEGIYTIYLDYIAHPRNGRWVAEIEDGSGNWIPIRSFSMYAASPASQSVRFANVRLGPGNHRIRFRFLGPHRNSQGPGTRGSFDRLRVEYVYDPLDDLPAETAQVQQYAQVADGDEGPVSNDALGSSGIAPVTPASASNANSNANSNVIKIGNNEIQVFPNPVRSHGTITVALSDATTGDYLAPRKFSIIDQTGRVRSQPQFSSGGLHTLKDVNLPPGVYYLSEEGKPENTTRFVVVR
ncbi:family 16 glycosylhydrolase [Lewinella sp. 4G2]|uniref:family 16 glycosylhydrolase n=1 Tax=Lewinella sp. 4G2 TaxID=1803372 RepID=UPI0007B4B772|nr:family 16 glycosylhydrolase [Lewinella sp. 4G2]OAV45283.1 hypothetical protein A3850_012610 [Lewinella sp. 4G2]